MLKNWRSGTTFGSSDAEKLYAAVAKSTFGSKNVKKLRVRDHFLKFRCSKIVRRCGEKHICKSKCTKHEVFGPLWYVLMLKNCQALWRNAHLQVKMCKTWRVWSTFVCSDVEKLHAAVASQNVQNTTGLEHFCLFRCRKIARRCGERHIWKWKCSKTVVFGALLDVLMFHNSTPLWRKAVSVSMMCVSSDRKPQVEVFALLHQFVIYFRSVSFSLPALTASVTKSSLPPVLSLDAMLDLCVSWVQFCILQ